MRARIIYNPTSGRETLKSSLHKIVESLSNMDYIVEVYPTKCEGDAIRFAKKSAFEKIDLLVVSGGDGTLHEVVNGIMQESYQPRLAYIPSGTTNDFAKSVGIPTDIDAAINVICNGEARKMDIGKIGDTYFIYVACFGAFTKVSYSTSSKLKSHLGQLAYVFSGVSEVPKLTAPITIKIETEDRTIEEQASIFLVVNSTGVAGLKNVLPNAKINDGKFDILLINSKNSGIIPELIRNMSSGLKTDINKNGLTHFEASKIRISSEKKIKWNLDGELGTVGDVEIECLKERVEIILPKKSTALK